MVEKSGLEPPRVINPYPCRTHPSVGEGVTIPMSAIPVKWWSRGESNPWPTDCQPVALPTELLPRVLECAGNPLHSL